MDDADRFDSNALSRRAFVVTASAGIAALGLGACGSSEDAKKGTGASPTDFSKGPSLEGTPVRGGTLRVGVVSNGAAETLSPLTAIAYPDIMRIYNLYDPLYFPTPGGKVKGALVESGEPNADATVWTLKLRRGVTWHDGKDFTADDVVYTIKRSWGNKKNIFNAALATVVDFDNVKKLDSHTVEVALKTGLSEFPSITCSQNCYIVQDGTTDFNNGVGTGPFKLKSFAAGKRSEFVANKDYWIEGRPYVDALVIDSSYSADPTRLRALLGKDLDIVPGVAPTLARANARSGRIVLGNQPGPGFVGLVMRVDSGPFKDPRVREALKLIPDRKQYNRAVYSGYGVPSNDCPGYTNQYWAKDLKSPQDLEKAKSLLKAAGQEGLRFALPTSTVVPGQSETATLFKQAAKGAGVNVDVKQYPPSTYYTAQIGFFTRPISVTYFNTGVNSLTSFYVTSILKGGPYNESHSGEDPAQNQLLLDALGEVDPGRAADKWHAVQEQQNKSGAYVIPATSNWVDAYSPSVRGVQTSSALSCDNFTFSGGWLAKA